MASEIPAQVPTPTETPTETLTETTETITATTSTRITTTEAKISDALVNEAASSEAVPTEAVPSNSSSSSSSSSSSDTPLTETPLPDSALADASMPDAPVSDPSSTEAARTEATEANMPAAVSSVPLDPTTTAVPASSSSTAVVVQVPFIHRVPSVLDKGLYQLILRQLEADGFGAIAKSLADEAKIEASPEPASGEPLKRLVDMGSQQALKRKRLESTDGGLVEFPINEDSTRHLDPSEDVFPSLSKPFPSYGKGTIVSSHKMTCAVVKFSLDGKFCASGSVDCCIKLMEVPKMHYYSHVKSGLTDDYTQNRPVMRTFYDHASAVNDLEFHPIEPVLASASKDCTIKLFDHAKAGRKQSSYSHKDTHSVRSMHFHPSGDFLLAGTEHPMIRLYDVNTWQAYVCPEARHHHLGAVTQVRYAPQGNMYASGSRDGSIKIWDGVNNTCVNHIERAHNGEVVSSLQFSPSGKYLLSGGKDSVHRLWEISTGKEVVAYVGGVSEKARTRTAFSYSGDFVVSSSEDDFSLLAWDTRTGELVKKLLGHTGTIRSIDASPVEEAFVSCGEDCKVRFWTTAEVPS